MKKALFEGEKLNSPNIPIKVKLVAPPLYVIITSCMDRPAGLSTMEAAIASISTSIQASGGQLVVKQKPRVVSDVDEKELDALMKKSELENAEVSGDDSTSE